MAQSSRGGVLAVKVESTEAVPAAPTASTDYVAIQDDLDMSPDIVSLENAETKASIGVSKAIQGAEEPKFSFSHYLRHSGVEGQAPNFKPFFKGGFGAETVVGTEVQTDASSTTTLIKGAADAGTTYPRGTGMLIKDGTNGYSIRASHSVSTNDITPSFALAAAPASGVGLGKPVTYSPANSGHQSMSLWHFMGNGAVVEMQAGFKAGEIGITFDAGELINCSISGESLGYYLNPITLGATDTKLDFEDDDGDHAATVTAKTYKDPHELASPTVTYSDTTGKFTIKTTGTLLTLKWSTGANTANTIGDKIGFTTSSDDSGTAAATGYTSDNAITLTAPQTPSYDSADPLVAKDNEVFIGDQSNNTVVNASNVTFTLSNTLRKLEDVCATSGFSSMIVNGREVTISVTAELDKYDASFWKKFRSNEELRFQYNFGVKSGGNWVPGKCGCIYVPTATVTSFNIQDDDGVATLELELKAFVDSNGQGEAFLTFL
jgi:hypothetical protein